MHVRGMWGLRVSECVYECVHMRNHTHVHVRACVHACVLQRMTLLFASVDVCCVVGVCALLRRWAR
jgi:hypothetical protein